MYVVRNKFSNPVQVTKQLQEIEKL